MAYVALPIIAGAVHQSFTLDLDGMAYGFALRYNTRGGCWMMSLATTDGTVLLAGVAVRLGVDLLDQYADTRFPAGRLFALNLVDEYAEAGRDNFGADVKMIYEEAQ